MARVREARDVLLAEGRRVLFGQGYAAIDVKQVASSCGMATGTFYNYFAGKKEFVLAVLRLDCEERREELTALLALDIPVRELLQRVMGMLGSYREESSAALSQIPLGPGERAQIVEVERTRMEGVASRIVTKALEGRDPAEGVTEADLISFVSDRLLAQMMVGAGSFDSFYACLQSLIGQPEDQQEQRPVIPEGEGHESLRMYEMAASDAKLVVWTYDFASHRVTMSDNAFSRMDYSTFSLPRIIENAPTSLVPYIDAGSVDAFLDMYHRVEAGEPTASCEVWYKLMAGQQPRCERITYTTAYDEGGRPYFAYGMGQNITAEKLAERRYEKAFRDLARAHPTSIASFHLNLTKNWAGDGVSDLDFVLEQESSGTVDGYFESFSRLIDDEKIKSWFKDAFDREKLIAAFDEGQTDVSFEYPIHYEDGTRHWRVGELHMLQNPTTGDIEGITYALDIDARKRVEMVVNTLERDVFGFLLLVDIPTGTILSGGGLDDGRFDGADYTSSMEEALHDIVPDETFDEAVHAHSLDTIKSRLDTAGSYELTFPTRNGHMLHWRFSYADEERLTVLIMREDVTEANRKEQARIDELESERRAHQHTAALLQSILDTAPVPMFWKDANRRFEGANKAFLDFYSFPSLGSILGKNDEDMGWHPDPGPYMNDELRVIEEGASTKRVPGLCESHGRMCHIVASKSPRFEDGHIVGLVGNFEDVTDEYEQSERMKRLNDDLQKALVEKERANDAQHEFLSSMSHDMRTPLNGILGFCDLALGVDDPAKRQHYLEKIQASGRLMVDLVNDVLDLSKIESGKMELRPSPFESAGLFDAVVDATRPTAEQRGITLDASMDGAYPQVIMADRLRCQQVVLNLLSNAVKYTPEGGHVSLAIERVESGETLVTVADDGIGMTPEFQTRMFEPFSQEHRADPSGTQGTGLGLSIVRRVVDLMRGRIEVVSAPSKGTTFRVYLPIGEASSTVSENQAAPAGTGHIAGTRILLCEDNDLNAEIAETVLRERGGADVVRARDGKDGLELFSASKPNEFDAILMDVRMPVMGGIEATRAIRALDRPDAASVPIIATTADAFDEDAQECIAAGMNKHVSKPVDPERLIGAVASLVGQRV